MSRRADLLLDTQVWVLWAAGLVPKPVQRDIEKASKIYYSIISPWELVIKRRYTETGLNLQQFCRLVEAISAQPLPVTASHVAALEGLPLIARHKDPYDRMLLAQAKAEGFTLVGSDRRFSAYEGVNLLWA